MSQIWKINGQSYTHAQLMEMKKQGLDPRKDKIEMKFITKSEKVEEVQEEKEVENEVQEEIKNDSETKELEVNEETAEKFEFNGKEYKTEAAMKAAITRAEKEETK